MTYKRNLAMNCKRTCNGLVFATIEHIKLGLMPNCEGCEAKDMKIKELESKQR